MVAATVLVGVFTGSVPNVLYHKKLGLFDDALQRSMPEMLRKLVSPAVDRAVGEATKAKVETIVEKATKKSLEDDTLTSSANAYSRSTTRVMTPEEHMDTIIIAFDLMPEMNHMCRKQRCTCKCTLKFYAVFAEGLFLLENGANKFIDHAAIVARRLGVSQTLVALLTAGAEWEEASEDSADDSNEGDSDDDDDELDTPATSSNLPEPAETFALLENGGDIETAN
ncbi:MAG: hypothetical protein MMC33_004515 [Icmadophila ericetorum]|nr:hypothetical protein [Icmadophila ericetorum]